MAMQLPDVNVLLAAFRPDHVHHAPAAAYLATARAGIAPLLLSDVALSAVIRLATNARVFIRPDTTEAVVAYTDALLDAPGLLLTASPTHWPRFTDMCARLGLRGNLVPDAYLAALAIDRGAELVTFDRGFARYPQLRWHCLLDAPA